MTVDLAQLQPGKVALEVGCGTGSLALAAKQRVGAQGRVCGMDPSAQIVARAEAKGTRRRRGRGVSGRGDRAAATSPTTPSMSSPAA